ncbi:DDE superfamily endonuclease [Kineococcus xinjiangensis]|uniref:DDE superfamily endonuclease n=1 Tax=Kineococcus xinjiangensis TaxID=512762 RepID=A0A2S6ICF5_9ACTN|nr:transposase family protein [Kineococcus xinjiangensis]PPK91908.1 DDE superfamily endonuclease [Kineococcus xinjiangensis]
MLFYRASLDVPVELAYDLATLLRAHRTLIGTRRGRRALGCYQQAVLALRWFRDATRIPALARDAGIGLATAYRYLHEVIVVLAAQAPDLHDVLAAALRSGQDHVLLDGTLIPSDRVNEPHRRSDRWYSGKHHRHGGNVQVLCAADGTPIWTSPVEPGSTHDLTAARRHALPALYPAATKGLPVLADKGYTGAGAGIHVPVRRPGGTHILDPVTRGWNSYINTHRAPVERGIAVLKKRWKALQQVSLCPQRIGDIVAAALVLTIHEKRY